MTEEFLTEEFLVLILVGMQGVLFAILCFLLGNAVRLVSRARRHRELLIQGQAELVAAADSNADAVHCPPALRHLPMHLKLQLFTRFAPNLRGESQRRLSQLAVVAGVTEWAEWRCRSRLWARRLQGIHVLTEVGGGERAAVVLLGDRNRLVRGQAILWAADRSEPEIIQAVIDHLEDEDSLCRYVAMDSLIRIGAPVVEPLAAYLSLEGTRGAGLGCGLRVALALADGRFLDVALRLCRHEQPEVRALASRILGAVGGSRGLELLQALLVDPEEEVRAAAAEALGRLGYWPAVARLADLLQDVSWDVRRAAGLALREMGAPGILFLRRSLKSPEVMARDMARQVLDLIQASAGRATS